MLKRADESRHPCQTPTIVRNQSPMRAIEEERTGSLVIKVFDNSDKVGADVHISSWLPTKLHAKPRRRPS